MKPPIGMELIPTGKKKGVFRVTEIEYTLVGKYEGDTMPTIMHLSKEALAVYFEPKKEKKVKKKKRKPSLFDF